MAFLPALLAGAGAGAAGAGAGAAGATGAGLGAGATGMGSTFAGLETAQKIAGLAQMLHPGQAQAPNMQGSTPSIIPRRRMF